MAGASDPSGRIAELEVVVRDEYALPVAYAIVDAARTGRIGDGRVTILPVGEAVT